MRCKNYGLLNLLLIILLMITPLRVVVAGNVQCPYMMNHTTMGRGSMSSMSSMNMSRQQASVSAGIRVKGTKMAMTSVLSYQCHCCDEAGCSGSQCNLQCNMGTPLSLLSYNVVSSPVFSVSNISTSFSPIAVLIQQTPPYRPPLQNL